jgi:integrase
MKGLYQRRGVWWVRFTPMPGTPQQRFSLGTKDEAKAIETARDIIDKVSKHAVDKAQGSLIEIEAYLSANHRNRLSASTISSRRYVLQSFVAETRLESPRLASTALIERWFAQRRQVYERTARAYMSQVKAWFKWLHASGKITVDPAAAIVLPKKEQRGRREFLLPNEARRLLSQCSDLQLKFALYCALHQGLRKLEIIEARCVWFDLEAGLLHVQATPTFETKDRDSRTVPLTNEFRDWLKSEFWPNGMPEPNSYAFHPEAKKGKYRYRYDFRKAYDKLVSDCGLNVTFHDLRRTFASLLVSAGVSLYKVAKWLGDTIEVVEESYGHLIQQDEDINKSWQAKPAAKSPGKAASSPAA